VIVLASVGGGKLEVGSLAMRALEKLAALQEQPVADDTRSSGQVTAASAPAGGRVTGVISGAPEQQVALVKVALLSLTGAELDAVPRGTFVVDMRERVAVADRDESGKFQFQSVAPGLYGIGLTTKGSSSGDKVALAESRVRRRISMMTTEEKEVGTPAVFKLAAGETLDLGTLWPKQ
jgi:hypothetical protein